MLMIMPFVAHAFQWHGRAPQSPGRPVEKEDAKIRCACGWTPVTSPVLTMVAYNYWSCAAQRDAEAHRGPADREQPILLHVAT
jgi:hypothetical protein